ncbi:MAG: hypothetical protein D6798_08005 [Deltaproteobacteria bacterium]|nr:MAG: hypothetical protein D6798_08005 [Deltaproteobacteria bacterium]
MTRTTPRRVARVLALLAAWASPARAAEFWAESAPVDSRQEATALRNELDLDALARQLEDGDISARVVRRLVEGQGWRYVLRVEGLDNKAATLIAAQAIAETGVSAGGWMREGDAVSPLGGLVEGVSAVDGAAGDGGGQPAELGAADSAGSEPVALPPARQVLRRAVRAHKGRTDPLELLEAATTVRFSCIREVTLADGRLRTRNRWWRQDHALRLEVEILEGSGVDSTTILTPDNRAWVVVDGTATPRDPTRTHEVLVRFGPAAVLAIPLGFPHDVDRAAAWQDLVVTGMVDWHGRPAWTLEPAAGPPEDEGLVSASFTDDDGRLVQVQWRTSAGLMRFDFDDYREVADGMWIPTSIGIWKDGAPVEQVHIEDLAVDLPLEGALFADP